MGLRSGRWGLTDDLDSCSAPLIVAFWWEWAKWHSFLCMNQHLMSLFCVEKHLSTVVWLWNECYQCFFKCLYWGCAAVCDCRVDSSGFVCHVQITVSLLQRNGWGGDLPSQTELTHLASEACAPFNCTASSYNGGNKIHKWDTKTHKLKQPWFKPYLDQISVFWLLF